MKYRCKNCEVEFPFTKKDIFSEKRTIDRKTGGRRTEYSETRYSVMKEWEQVELTEKKLKCPICFHKNILVITHSLILRTYDLEHGNFSLKPLFSYWGEEDDYDG